MRKMLFLVMLSVVPGSADKAKAEDTLYPAGSGIICTYELSADTLFDSDTLVLNRRLINDGSHTLDGLYFSDNLPSEFEVLSHTLSVNGSLVSYYYQEPAMDSVVSGYNWLAWVVDDPTGASGATLQINPHDTVVLGLTLVCQMAGDYQLPSHAAAFYDGGGFFAGGPSLGVVVLPSVDIIPPTRIDDLQAGK